MLSAGPISHNSIHLHFPNLLDTLFSLLLRFLPVLSMAATVCSVLSFVLFSLVMLSIKSSLLFYQYYCSSFHFGRGRDT